MSAILFFDSASGGHHGEFLENVIYGLPKAFSVDCVVFTHPDLKSRLKAAKTDCDSGVSLRYLDVVQLDRLSDAKSPFERGRLELNIVEEACINYGIHKVLIMHMNIHQYALSMMSNKPDISVRGILLDPYTPIRRAHTFKQKAFASVTALRKRFQFRLMFCNPQIDRVFLLNDARVAEELNRSYFKRLPFSSIADPIPAVVSRCEALAESKVNESQRYTFLLIGSMAPRKGCLMVLKAMQQMTGDELSQIRLRLVGKFRVEEVDYRADVLSAIQDLQSKCPNVDIGVEDRYVDFSEMNAELMSADCILVPYIEFYGSSGVLGHACRAGKPVIACEEGLIGELVSKLEIGLTVNPKDLGALCRCLQIALDGKLPFNLETARNYVKDAGYKNFSKTLIADWNE